MAVFMDHPYLKSQSIDRVRAHMARAGVEEADLDERFVLGSGSGGQKVNKTSSAVVLRHLPSNTVIKCQHTRSREVNRWLARRLLAERLLEKVAGEKSARQQREERVRRQKRRRSRRQRDRMLADKHHHAARKAGRKTVDAGAEN
jgi:protein subunit release factor B